MRSASGLIDGDGCLQRDVPSLRRHLLTEETEVGMQTQMKRARSAEVPITLCGFDKGA